MQDDHKPKYIPQPKAPLTNLDQPGLQRIQHLMAIFAISRPTVYRFIEAGLLPAPDMKVRTTPFWKNETLLPYYQNLVGTPTKSADHSASE